MNIDLKSMTLRELYKLYQHIGIEMLRRLWPFYLAFIIFIIALTWYFSKRKK